MVRPGRNEKRIEARPPQPEVVRPIQHVLARSREVGNNSIPIRTVLYIEVGDIPTKAAKEAMHHVMNDLDTGHKHFCVLARHGKLASDIEFEGEFLNTVNLLCEVVDGQIVMRDGAKDVEVIRRKI